MGTVKMTHTKLHINLAQGLVEIEGDEKLVREIYADFKPQLLQREQQLRTSPPKSKVDKGPTGQQRRVSRKRSGPSFGGRIRELEGEDYFSTERTTTDVRGELRNKGHADVGREVSSALRGEPKRRSIETGPAREKLEIRQPIGRIGK